MAAIIQFQLRRNWRELRRGRPGHRFRARYERVHQNQQRGGVAERVLLVALAIVFFAIGVVLVVMPGPAFLFFILAGGLLASESRFIAGIMDRSEVSIRRVVGWGKRTWDRLPVAARGVLIALAACGSAGAVFLGYRLMRG